MVMSASSMAPNGTGAQNPVLHPNPCSMNITIVEHGTFGLRLARALSGHHRVHLLRSQESTPDELPADIGPTVACGQTGERSTGLVVTDAISTAFIKADHVIFTPPVEYGGGHHRYNELLCEVILQDALTFNATASFALQTLVSPGFSDRLSHEFRLPRLVHAHMREPLPQDTYRHADRGQIVIGGPADAANAHAALLRQAFGDRFRSLQVQRPESEAVAVLAAQLDLSVPSAVRQTTVYARQHGLNARVLIECLGLLKPVSGSFAASSGATEPAPLGARTRLAF